LNSKLSSGPLKQQSYFTDFTINKTSRSWDFQLTTFLLKSRTFTFQKFSVFASTSKWSIRNKNFFCQFSFIWSLNWPMIQMWEEFGRSKCITISSDLQNRIWQNSQKMKWGKCRRTKRNWSKFGPRRTTWPWKSTSNTCIMRKSRTNKIWWNNLKLQLKLRPNPLIKAINKKSLKCLSKKCSLRGKKCKLQADANPSYFYWIMIIKFTCLFGMNKWIDSLIINFLKYKISIPLIIVFSLPADTLWLCLPISNVTVWKIV
jgi:hypothetical protein